MLTEVDGARPMQMAPHHSIELLTPDALRPVATAGAAVTAEMLDVLSIDIQVLAEAGAGNDDLCLIRGRMPPGAVVPLHPRPTARCFTGRRPHALRNRGNVPADTLLVTTQRIAGLFCEMAARRRWRRLDRRPEDWLEALAAVWHARGYWLGDTAGDVALALLLDVLTRLPLIQNTASSLKGALSSLRPCWPPP